MTGAEIRYATVDWSSPEGPYSPLFEDIYHSRSGAAGEGEHVFLRGNALPERFRSGTRVTIAEAGFGTGLNFLLSWRLWRETAPPQGRLHYLAAEKFPLSPEDLVRGFSLYPRLEPLGKELLTVYPLALPGFHRVFLEGGHLVVTFLWGDLCSQLEAVEAPDAGIVDAWFLDGFAPAKNPEMWSPRLYEQMARLTRAEGTVATYTVSGEVRRGLEGAGFAVSKAPGFGDKREMTRGRFRTLRKDFCDPRDRTAVIVGGGLAGTASAQRLLARDWRITLIERRDGPARETSGNRVGIVNPHLSPGNPVRSRFYLHAFEYTRRHLDTLRETDPTFSWQPCGVLELGNEARTNRRRNILEKGGYPDAVVRGVEAVEASRICGFPVSDPGLYYPRAGWVRPPSVCRANLRDNRSRLTTRYRAEAISLKREGDLWTVLGADGKDLGRGAAVIIANAQDAVRFSTCRFLPLQTVRGQLTVLDATPRSQGLRVVLLYGGYVLPADRGTHTVGATFDRGRTDRGMDPADHERNLSRLKALLPDLHAAFALPARGAPDGRVGFRSTAPDYLPVAGSVGWEPGIYLNLAHGSRGLVSTPLCAEIIASSLNGEPLPIERELVAAVGPERFLAEKSTTS